MNKSMLKNINDMIDNQEYQKAQKLIENYKEQVGCDIDIYPLEAKWLVAINKPQEAYNVAKEAIRKNPYNIEMNVLMREAAKLTGHMTEAMKYNVILKWLQLYFRKEEDLFDEDLEQMVIQQSEEIIKSGDREKIIENQSEINYIMDHMDTYFGLLDESLRKRGIIGKEYVDIYGKKKYISSYNATGADEILKYGLTKEESELLKGWATSKIEYLDTIKGKEFKSDDCYESLIPMLSQKSNQLYAFVLENGKIIPFKGKKENHFNYYKVPPRTTIVAENEVYMGTPILLKQKADRKKLVLNIFLDGLSQKILREEGIKNVMPNAAKFFGKGVICDNAYSGGEWTLPSVANYVTGTSTAHHMILHNQLTYQLPKEVTVLAEYFKEQGYYTAKIDGEWRSTPIYGYARGMDRIIFQYQHTRMKARQVIGDVMDHIELMKDTNQFVWMCIGDLHDIADGFDMIPNVQKNIVIEDYEVEEAGKTSVKQAYSKKKRAKYVALLKYIDRALKELFDYIEINYTDEEMLVSMFGDHGQGYLLEEGEPFLAEGRTNVGMMFRTNYRQGEVCRDLISSSDYINIMCKLAGIPMKNEMIDGRLPKFFGGTEEREYVLSESIHPGDPYAAALFYKGGMFFFQTEAKAEYDGRSKLEPYHYRIIAQEPDAKSEDERVQECLELIKKNASHIFIYEN